MEISEGEFFEVYTEWALNFSSEDEFIHFLEQSWGVVESNQEVDPGFLAELDTLLQTIRDAILKKGVESQ